jgi:predicted dehydrogenase
MNKYNKKKLFNVGIIGCGLIGKKRADNLGKKAKLIACADISIKNAKLISNNNKKIIIFKNWRELIKIKELNIVIISTPHNQLSRILLESIKKGKHVFIEKPASINLSELKSIIHKNKRLKRKIRVGYNHRYLSAIIKCKELINKKILGNLMFIKASYGHGGRFGYEKEWRMNPKISGGGELIDQGSHLIDLSELFFGKVIKAEGTVRDFFWKKKVDDNAFITLKFKKKLISFLHLSCTEWKNNFLFEIYGTKGKLRVEGKGGSYGREKLTLYKITRKKTYPRMFSWNFKKKDYSWSRELNEFYKDIEYNREPNPNLEQAYNILKVVKKIYKINRYDYNS